MNIGERLPAFQLENQYGESILSADLSVGRVFLVFYPWAFSRVCGGELAELQAHLAEFRGANARLVAISVDHKFTLRSYAEQEGFEFELLADFWPHGAVARALGAFDAERGVARRVSLYLQDGVVTGRFESELGRPRAWELYERALTSR